MIFSLTLVDPEFGIFATFPYNVRTSAPQARFQNHTAANVVMEPKVLLMPENLKPANFPVLPSFTSPRN